MLLLHRAKEASSSGLRSHQFLFVILAMWNREATCNECTRATMVIHGVGDDAEPCLQAVPGSTQYEARSLAEQEKENLLTSEAVAQFLDRVWPR